MININIFFFSKIHRMLIEMFIKRLRAWALSPLPGACHFNLAKHVDGQDKRGHDPRRTFYIKY